MKIHYLWNGWWNPLEWNGWYVYVYACYFFHILCMTKNQRERLHKRKIDRSPPEDKILNFGFHKEKNLDEKAKLINKEMEEKQRN